MNTIDLNLGGEVFTFEYNHDFSHFKVLMYNNHVPFNFRLLKLDCGTIISKENLIDIVKMKLATKVKNNWK